MSALTIAQRLDKLFPIFCEPRFLSNQGLGKEIGFHIFDYDPECDPLVQNYLVGLKSRLESSPHSLKVLEINLYYVILELLEARNLLQKALDLETKQGSTAFNKSIRPLLRPEKIVEVIQNRLTGDEQLIWLTGVGAIYPWMRSHTILNNLHPILDTTPLVMFFPGFYDGQELRLFNTLKDDNYYRAFPLIPRNSEQ
ncbi:DUF1788 domain-containing protein [Spirulina sp. 06S082]|uniref:DUF1788 domain-containing protein n=1 Tax=Spirulina sp. 06S082 TaxID=3110248 RepID=UPI002B204FFE|nr:DUF1788 domain-containing protein [Spirulina sp. 06S082]MEA5469928.1 DUF1788 domain-containing protein [Spirulina sp. 06S082]